VKPLWVAVVICNCFCSLLPFKFVAKLLDNPSVLNAWQRLLPLVKLGNGFLVSACFALTLRRPHGFETTVSVRASVGLG